MMESKTMEGVILSNDDDNSNKVNIHDNNTTSNPTHSTANTTTADTANNTSNNHIPLSSKLHDLHDLHDILNDNINNINDHTSRILQQQEYDILFACSQRMHDIEAE